jgi:hypothetical protein
LRSKRFTRGTVLAVVTGMLAVLVGWPPSPAAAAPVGQLCRDSFTITKPTPPRDQLPGFGTKRETPDPAGNLRPYKYNSPGENVRGTPPPAAALEEIYGSNPSGKAPGSLEHLYASWFKYLKRKQTELDKWNQTHQGKKPSPALSWDRWLNSYIPNQGNDARGKGFERLLVEEIGLGGDDWVCQGEVEQDGQVRRYDAINARENIAYEFKSGRTIDAAELAKDKLIAAKQGTRVVYVFGDPPTNATVAKLRAAGVDYHVMRATPEPVNPFLKPNPGPSSQLMNPNPNVPSQGAFNDIIGASGNNLEEAQEVAAVEDELAEESGAFSQQLRRPGGIDFSTMQLRYVSDADAGPGGLRYSFEAGDAVDEDNTPSSGGLPKAQLSSDALFTWLALPPSSFWVNLNPDQPDKIIDSQFAKTDAGRVLLESDLLLKRTHAKLLDPSTPLGKRFWDAVHFDSATVFPCLPLRLWITAAPASVREDGGQLYILDAPLKANAEFFKVSTLPPGVRCQQTDAVAEENVKVYQQIVLPELDKEVNTDPGFADLRRVYLSRVAAEWLRKRSAGKANPFTPIIGSNNVSRWPARTPWNPQDVYQSYLKSYNNGDYTYTRTVKDGTQTVTVTFTMGGVDFGQSPQQPVSTATFQTQHPTLPATVTGSTLVPLAYGKADASQTWLGGDTAAERVAAPSPSSTPPGTLPVTGAPLALLAGAAVMLLAGGTGLLAWSRRQSRAAPSRRR